MSKKSKSSRRTHVASPKTDNQAWWERLSARQQHGVCVLLLFAIALGLFAPLHFSNKYLVGGVTVILRDTAQVLLT